MASAKKIFKKTAGTIVFGFGVASKLAELGLNVSEVVICGFKSLSQEFTKASDFHTGDFLQSNAKKGTKKLSQMFFKKAKELWH